MPLCAHADCAVKEARKASLLPMPCWKRKAHHREFHNGSIEQQFKEVLRETSQAVYEHGISLEEVGLELNLEGWHRGSKEDISSRELA